MSLFKDDPALAKSRLKPSQPISLGNDDSLAAAMTRVHNRIGALIAKFSLVTGLPPAAALAVWYVESAGAPFKRGKPILRFENHKFFSFWGKGHQELFNAHFQFGGNAGITGSAWQNHRYRLKPDHEWLTFHGNQHREYEVINLAARVSSRELAFQSASFGGPQIMGFNHAIIGYRSAEEMFKAFSRSERWQVIGFFDFCRAKDLIEAISSQHWLDFATVYNGPGNAESYRGKLETALEAARTI